MSGIASESALVIDAAVRRLRRSLVTLGAALPRIVDRVPVRPLLASAVLIVGSVSAAYAILSRPVPEASAELLAEVPADAALGSVRARCPHCGVVESLHELAVGEDPRGVRTYEVTLRMKDGSSHRFTDTNPANWRLGERVTLISESTRLRD